MYIKYLTLILLLFSLTVYSQNTPSLHEQIKKNEILSYGGCNIIELNDTVYLVSAAMVVANNQPVTVLRRIAHSKALREAVSFVKGSEITSTESMSIEEKTITVDGETKTVLNEAYYMQIVQKDQGFVKGMKPLGHWYTDNKETFHFAIYKLIK